MLSDGPLTAHSRDDAGFTLIEVLLAMTLMLIVFSTPSSSSAPGRSVLRPG